MELIVEFIKQQEWHKQFFEHYDKPHIKFIRRTDRMSIKEILDLYRQNLIPCDTCDRNISLKGSKLTLLDHISHTLNPKCLWGCDICIQRDYREGRIIEDNLK